MLTEQSLQWFAQNLQPDLLFSDIQLADGLCFDIYNQVAIKSPIIFCTAFDGYLMNAFDTNAISYLLKPVTKEKLEKALEKFRSLKSVFEKEKNIQTSLYTPNAVSILSKVCPCAVACRLFCKLCFVSGYVWLAKEPANASAYFFFNFFVFFRSFLSSDFTFLSIFLRSSSAGKFSGLIPLFINSPLTS